MNKMIAFVSPVGQAVLNFMRFNWFSVQDFMFFIGFCSFVYGVSLIFIPAAWLIAGIILMGLPLKSMLK